MGYVYLISAVFLSATYSIFGGFYNRKNENKNVTLLYSTLLFSAVFIFWLIMFLFDGEVNVHVIPYSILFAFFYTICSIVSVVALKTGPIILTSLIIQLSCILTAVWGFFFWNESFTLLVGIGLATVVVSLGLCLYNKKQSEQKNVTPKWIFYVFIVLVFNAGCMIVQKTQQLRFNGKYGNFLMVVAMGIAFVSSLIIYLFSNDKSGHKLVVKSSGIYPVLAGTCNGLLNLCTILLATSTLSSSLVYPVVAVGGLAITTIFSALVFKEKMYWWQWLGIVLGAISVVLLSI